MRRGLAVVACVLALAACASTVPVASTGEGFAYHDDPHLQKVWLADRFRFQDYQMFLLEEPRTAVANVHPDGVDNLAWARGVLRDEILAALRAKKLFPAVAMATPIPPETRSLRLETTIIEYEKGGGGARFFAGVYGAEFGGKYGEFKEELLAHLFDSERVAPEDAVMIGDRAGDIRAARAHRVRSIGVLWGYGSEAELLEAGADALCASPKELIACLSRLSS